eukprot:742346-Rhodomonas_salina.1
MEAEGKEGRCSKEWGRCGEDVGKQLLGVERGVRCAGQCAAKQGDVLAFDFHREVHYIQKNPEIENKVPPSVWRFPFARLACLVLPPATLYAASLTR